MFNKIEEAIEDIKKGKIIIIVDDEDRENEGDFYMSSEFATPENVNFMITHGKGLLCLTVDNKIAKRLDLDYMVRKNEDELGTAFTFSIDHINSKTGISAFERSETILAAVDENSSSRDFKKPGHIFPLIAKEFGVLERIGHTEASVDLSKLAGHKGSGVICEIIKDDGSMARRDDLFIIAKEHNLKVITIKDLVEYRKKHYAHFEVSSEITLPTEFGEFRCKSFTDLMSGKEHMALFINDNEKTPMVRIHSECLTGDVFSSKRCDCGSQLSNALRKIKEHGSGALVYLRQEGRDIGLTNKINAYKLQEEGCDTVEANIKLGFDVDEREYYVGSNILKNLGFTNIKLLTNSPDKIKNVSELGINIEETLLIHGNVVDENKKYIQTKIDKLNHELVV